MSRIPVSVFIIAKNEADRISYAIKSVRDWVDEVIVIDSGSTDDTVKTSKELGASLVVFNEWKGYGPQKVYGESLCRNEWLLNIDADEEITPELAEEIKALFADGEPKYKSYAMRGKIVFMYQDKPARFGPVSYYTRLYNKKYAGFKDSTVHDSVVARSPEAQTPYRLKGIFNHRCFRSISHMIEKINFYTSMQAEDLVKRGKSPSSLRLVFEPFFAFIKCYFIKRYIVYGLDGFVHSIIYAANRTLRLAKARELILKNKTNS